jgi:general secretion pathway protein B
LSLILDALNRSRQDTDAVPGLATQHYSDNPEPGGNKLRQYLPWGALLLALGIIALLVLERELRTVAVPDVAPIAAPGPAPAAPASVVPEVKTEVKTQAPSPVELTATPAAPGAALQEKEQAAPPPGITESVAPAAQTLPATDRVDESVARLYQQPPVTNPESAPARANAAPANPPDTAATEPDAAGSANREEQPIDIEKLILKARDELANADLDAHHAPFIADLSQHTKNDIPTIYYQRHDYSGDSARSTVVLNGKTLKVGGTAAPGVKVEEILPDSVVLDYRGTQFRLRSLNSWINL